MSLPSPSEVAGRTISLSALGKVLVGGEAEAGAEVVLLGVGAPAAEETVWAQVFLRGAAVCHLLVFSGAGSS